MKNNLENLVRSYVGHIGTILFFVDDTNGLQDGADVYYYAGKYEHPLNNQNYDEPVKKLVGWYCLHTRQWLIFPFTSFSKKEGQKYIEDMLIVNFEKCVQDFELLYSLSMELCATTCKQFIYKEKNTP